MWVQLIIMFLVLLSIGFTARIILSNLRGNTTHNASLEVEPKPITDRQILQAAVEAKGSLTATGLCLKIDMSIEEAQERLEQMHKNGTFDIQVDDLGNIRYELRDKNLLH
ncbi:MAG: hypothetical protein JJT94_02750 [Bernardetiaceae bacterium]|nr:hypothetical protein [Bernardetiaceae bacterium]